MERSAYLAAGGFYMNAENLADLYVELSDLAMKEK